MHQIERHHHHHAVLGRALCGNEEEHADVKTDQYHVDGLSIQLVLNPTVST